MFESVFNFCRPGPATLLKKTPALVFSCKICEIFKSICERLVLFVSPQNAIANSSSSEFGLGETLAEGI